MLQLFSIHKSFTLNLSALDITTIFENNTIQIPKGQLLYHDHTFLFEGLVTGKEFSIDRSIRYDGWNSFAPRVQVRIIEKENYCVLNLVFRLRGFVNYILLLISGFGLIYAVFFVLKADSWLDFILSSPILIVIIVLLIGRFAFMLSVRSTLEFLKELFLNKMILKE